MSDENKPQLSKSQIATLLKIGRGEVENYFHKYDPLKPRKWRGGRPCTIRSLAKFGLVSVPFVKDPDSVFPELTDAGKRALEEATK